MPSMIVLNARRTRKLPGVRSPEARGSPGAPGD